ncbi:MAG: pyrroloquinoline quinone biosynthesis protein PqqB [Flavipsychrobacter sp.]|jgi:pyrroloquinoline quinone biosynthesis protein B|nr:pyrroloquinoline quinone biosynthesis protein PqqB [Flavipsychrobacter sp.]
MSKKITHICIILLLTFNASAQKADAPHIIVLGVAQDGGYPHMGCSRQCCSRTWKNEGLRRYVVSLALVNPATKQWWLFEATPDIKEQLQYFKQLTNGDYNFLPDGIFITHAHMGHYTGLMHLGKEVMSTHEVPVYTLPKLKKYLETNGPWSQLVNIHNIVTVGMMEYKHGDNNDAAVTLGSGINVFAYRVPHRDEYSETAGFRIETPNKKYLFIPDINKWALWKTSIIEVTKSVDVALVDATFYDQNDLPARNLANVPHPLVTETMKLFEKETAETKAKVRLIHFNHTNPLLWDKTKQKTVKDAGFNYAKQGEKI